MHCRYNLLHTGDTNSFFYNPFALRGYKGMYMNILRTIKIYMYHRLNTLSMHVQSYPSHKIKSRLPFQALHNREVPPSYDGLFYGVWASGPMSQAAPTLCSPGQWPSQIG